MIKSILALFRNPSLIDQALEECHEMLALDWKMFQYATETLRRADTAAEPIDIHDADQQVNRSERDVRRKVITHLCLAGDDVSAGLVAVSVVIDIERIGDYTKNIYELAQQHPAPLNAGPVEDKVAILEDRVAELFQRTAQAFHDGDMDTSRQIMAEYRKELAAEFDDVINAIVSGRTRDLAPERAAAVCLYVRSLKRIASHLRTIVTSVVNPFHRLGYKEKKEADERPGTPA